MFCLLFVSLFLLKLFALQNRLRKGRFPASWSVSLFLFLCFSTQNPSGEGVQWPFVQGLISLHHKHLLWVPTMTSLYVFLLWYLIIGKNYKEESQIVFTVFQRCSLQSHHIGRYVVFGVTVFYDYVTMVLLKHMLHMDKNHIFVKAPEVP